MSEDKLELESIKDSDEQYSVAVVCADCGAELNRTKPMTGKEIWKDWTMLVMGSGFNAGSCPKGCRATYSDLNINTNLKIVSLSPSEGIIK